LQKLPRRSLENQQNKLYSRCKRSAGGFVRFTESKRPYKGHSRCQSFKLSNVRLTRNGNTGSLPSAEGVSRIFSHGCKLDSCVHALQFGEEAADIQGNKGIRALPSSIL